MKSRSKLALKHFDNKLKHRLTICIVFCCLATPLLCSAEVYRKTDESGHIQYSDLPHSPADEPVELPALNAIPFIIPQTTSLGAEKTINSQLRYSISIQAPAPESTFHHDVTNISVEIALTPSLQTPHFLQYYLDNMPLGSLTKNQTATLSNLSRGAHTIQVAIVEKMKDQRGLWVEKRLTTSPPITIFQQRYHQ